MSFVLEHDPVDAGHLVVADGELDITATMLYIENAPPGARWSRADCIACRGEEIALQPQRAGSGNQGQRVGQCEQDQVVLLVGVRQERTAVVDVRRDPRVLVGVVGVVGLPELRAAAGRSRPRRRACTP